jgi:hypothetical protein
VVGDRDQRQRGHAQHALGDWPAASARTPSLPGNPEQLSMWVNIAA